VLINLLQILAPRKTSFNKGHALQQTGIFDMFTPVWTKKQIFGMKLSIVTKIILLFSATLVLFAAVSYFGSQSMKSTTKALYRINEGYIPLTQISAQIETSQKNHQNAVARVMEADEARVRRVLIRMLSNYYPKIARQNVVRGMAHCDKMLLVTQDEKQQDFLEKTKEQLLAIQKQQEKYVEQVEEFIRLSEENPESGEIQKKGQELSLQESALSKSIKKLSLYLDDQISRSVLWVEEQSDRAQWAYILLTLSALLVGLALTTISVFLLKPIRRLTEAAVRIGRGEYGGNVGVKSGDELGRLADEFDRMRQSLAERDRALVSQRDELANKAADLNNLKIHYENIIKTLWSCVLVTDTKGRLTTANPRARMLWGSERISAHEGKSVKELPVGEGTLGDKLDFERVITQKMPVSRYAVAMHDSNGTLRRISFTAVPFLEEEQLRGILILGEDVTDELEMKERLNMAERMAAVGQMAARITHEVRNPLSSISLNVEMLQEEILSENTNKDEAVSLINSIIRQIERLREITSEYLKFARMPNPEKHLTDLNRTLGELINFMEPEFAQAGLTCVFRPQKEKLLCEVDENLIVQAFLNLVKNAEEASPAGANIAINTEENDGEIRISVADQGNGIPEEARDRIFEVFFSTKPNGSGLGLAIANQIITAHGGSISFADGKDGGTVFTVSLPKTGTEQ